MTPDQIILLLNSITVLGNLIDREVEMLRARGEMTPEAEAAYQERQKTIYSRPEAQPELQPAPPPPQQAPS